MPLRFLSLLAVAAVIVAGAGGCGSEAQTASKNANGTAADTAQVEPELVQAADFDLADYEGQVVLLNFWATWCGPCRAEMPDLVELQAQRGEDGLQIVGVAVDQQGEEAVMPYLTQDPVNYPIVIDPKSQIGEGYGGVYRLPTTLVIGPDGEVRERIIGRVRLEDLQPYVDGLLASVAGEDAGSPS